MANLFRRSRQSYDFPLAERADAPPPEQAESENKPMRSASIDRLEPLISRENVAAPPRDAVVKHTKRDFFLCIGLLLVFTVICVAGVVVLRMFVFFDADAPPPDQADKEPEPELKALRSGSIGKLEPLISRENVAAPPRDTVIKHTKRDFCICITLLIVFTAICVAGIVVLQLFVFLDGKELLLTSRRQDVEHGVANPDDS